MTDDEKRGGAGEAMTARGLVAVGWVIAFMLALRYAAPWLIAQ